MQKCTSSKVILLFTCLFMCYQLYDCHTINDTYSLLSDKLANYNRKIRPTVNQSAPTEVNFGFELISINEFDELQEKLSVVAVIRMNWVDEMIQWNPADYGGMYTVLTESDSFWIPNFVLTNTAVKLNKIGDDWQSIRIVYNGSVYYYPLGIYSSSCSADITLYPWDIHYCVLSFTPQGHLGNEMTIQTIGNKVVTEHYLDNGAWKFIDSSLQSFYTNNYMRVEVEFVFERKPRFAIVNLVLPIIFMAVLSTVVFLIPTDSGERISYAITMLLAIAVFLTLVGDNLPKTSTPMSYFSYYLLALLAISICVSLATIFSLRMYYYDGSIPVTGFLAKLPSCMKTVCRKEQEAKKNGNDVQNTKLEDSDKTFFHSKEKIQDVSKKDISSTKSDILPAAVHLTRPIRVQPEISWAEKPDTEKLSAVSDGSDIVKYVSWKDVSVALDTVFFILFNILLTIATFVYFLLILASERIQIEDK